MYEPDYSWKWLKEKWEELSTVEKTEATLRTLFFAPVRAVIRFRAISLTLVILLCAFGLSQCDGCTSPFDLSENGVSQYDMEEIAEAINCAWSDKIDACFCVYVNGGTVGFAAPDKSCER